MKRITRWAKVQNRFNRAVYAARDANPGREEWAMQREILRMLERRESRDKQDRKRKRGRQQKRLNAFYFTT